ncbi:MAG: DUF1499 domain-containing protein [Gammaproteobacteria bacterium]|jgi:uncharacterized protein (DUF1499 family)
MADRLGSSRTWPGRLGRASFYLALFAGLALVVAGPGHRLGLVGVMPGIWLAMAGGALAALALLLGIIALFGILGTPGRPAFASAVLAVALGAVISLQLYGWFAKARSVPPIHDISTDLEDPPTFSAIAPLRANAPNPAAWPGPENAEMQRRAYPGVQTLIVDEAPEAVIAEAREIARALGWEVIASEPRAGRLEAVDTTFWFGFRDDVVVRAQRIDAGTAVDVRSKSRVGRSDLGTNARRIGLFLSALEEKLGGGD